VTCILLTFLKVEIIYFLANEEEELDLDGKFK